MYTKAYREHVSEQGLYEVELTYVWQVITESKLLKLVFEVHVFSHLGTLESSYPVLCIFR